MSISDKLFVAVTDDLLYEHPEQIDGPLVPYSNQLHCHHWLEVEINPDDVIRSGAGDNRNNFIVA
ncbi:MAG: hypothetical protein ACRBHB_18705 [Arenicella sp.]